MSAANELTRPMWVVIPEDSILEINPPRVVRPVYEPCYDRDGFEYRMPSGPIRYSDCELVIKPTAEHDRLFLNLWRNGEFVKFDVRMARCRFVFEGMVTEICAKTCGIHVSLRITGRVRQEPFYGESPLDSVTKALQRRLLFDARYRQRHDMIEAYFRSRERVLTFDEARSYVSEQQAIKYNIHPPLINIDASSLEAASKALDEYLKTPGRLTRTKGVEVLDRHRSKQPITKDQVKANRYYVGSKSVFRDAWGHATPTAAVDHATKLLESNDGEEQYVVKIIKVIRRKPQPIQVEDVK